MSSSQKDVSPRRLFGVWSACAFALVVAALAACGGGGGGGGGNAGGSGGGSGGGGTSYTIGGSLSGLGSSAAVVLQNNGGDNLSVGANGTFQFATAVVSGGAYNVTVLTQPAGQTCVVSGGAGAATANVTSVQVTCGSSSGLYAISGAITPANSAAGSVVTLSGAASARTLADAAGHYGFAGLSPGSYTVTPSGPSTSFSPTSLPVTIVNADVTAANIAATANVIFFDDFAGSSLGSEWSIISRHGAYWQNETECNTAGQVTVASSVLNIATAAQATTCGDFNIDGSVRNAPRSWPYNTGAVQWRTRSYTYGTLTVRAKFPNENTSLWPAIWLLGANCENTNLYTADVDYDTCPAQTSSRYAEVDAVECDTANWCQLALANFANTGSGGAQFPTCGYPVDEQFHVFTLTWTSTEVRAWVDGRDTGCAFRSPAWTIPSTPMFLIIQTQTGGIGGTPNNAHLPANFQIDWVKVTQP
ncbi:MAG TPA: family 16 glycosylhydrolase [Caulobacterales bacterium]|nr:family 16 glycosylhydrolase [Caulobacterales bacterium]